MQALSECGDVAGHHAHHTLSSLARRAATVSRELLQASRLQCIDGELPPLETEVLRECATLLSPDTIAAKVSSVLESIAQDLKAACAPLSRVLCATCVKWVVPSTTMDCDIWGPSEENLRNSLDCNESPADRITRTGMSRNKQPIFAVYFASQAATAKALEGAEQMHGLGWSLTSTSLFLCIVDGPSEAARRFINCMTERRDHQPTPDVYVAKRTDSCLVLRPSAPSPEGLRTLQSNLQCCFHLNQQQIFSEDDLCIVVDAQCLSSTFSADEILHCDEQDDGRLAVIASPAACRRLGKMDPLICKRLVSGEEDALDLTPIPAGVTLPGGQLTRWFPRYTLKQAQQFAAVCPEEYVDCDWHTGDWLQFWRQHQGLTTGAVRGNWHLRGLLQIVAFTTQVAIGRGGYVPSSMPSVLPAAASQPSNSKDSTFVLVVGGDETLLSHLVSKLDAVTTLENITASRLKHIKTVLDSPDIQNKDLLAYKCSPAQKFLDCPATDQGSLGRFPAAWPQCRDLARAGCRLDQCVP